MDGVDVMNPEHCTCGDGWHQVDEEVHIFEERVTKKKNGYIVRSDWKWFVVSKRRIYTWITKHLSKEMGRESRTN